MSRKNDNSHGCYCSLRPPGRTKQLHKLTHDEMSLRNISARVARIPQPVLFIGTEYRHTWANGRNKQKLAQVPNFAGATPGESPLPPIAPGKAPSGAGTLSLSSVLLGVRPDETAAAPSVSPTADAAADHSWPDDQDQQYEQRDHRAECQQIFHAGAF